MNWKELTLVNHGHSGSYLPENTVNRSYFNRLTGICGYIPVENRTQTMLNSSKKFASIIQAEKDIAFLHKYWTLELQQATIL